MYKNKLTRLELEVLNTMARRTPTDILSLRSQVEGCTVLKRQNSGVGFFTTLKPNKTGKLINEKIIGNVFVDVDGLTNPMTFVLFMENGYMSVLEGAAVDESTTSVDFTKDLIFQIHEAEGRK